MSFACGPSDTWDVLLRNDCMHTSMEAVSGGQNEGGAMINEVLVVGNIIFWILFAYMIWRWMRIGEQK